MHIIYALLYKTILSNFTINNKIQGELDVKYLIIKRKYIKISREGRQVGYYMSVWEKNYLFLYFRRFLYNNSRYVLGLLLIVEKNQ